MLNVQPTTWKEACAITRRWHRHYSLPQDWKFGIAVSNRKKIVGVVMIGRPVARHLDNGWTLEITRLCTDGTKSAASMLLEVARRVTFALGDRRLITYTLQTRRE